MIPQVKKQYVEVLGWHGYKFSNMTLEPAYGREMNIQLSACQLNAPSTLEISVAVYCVTKLHHFRVVFYCPRHKMHLYNDHAV